MQLSSSTLPAAPPSLSLVVTALVVMGSPGPATVSVTAVGAAFGIRRSLRYLGGVVVGTVAVLVAVVVGLGSLLTAHPHLTPVLVGLSVAYLLHLAYRIATAPPLPAAGDRLDPPGWTGGLVLAVANPKAYAAIASVVAGADPGPVAETLTTTLVLVALIVLVHLGWLVAGVCLTAALRRPRLARLINASLALALLGSTVPAVTHVLAHAPG